jgi:predicted Rossmann fold flavoprotein
MEKYSTAIVGGGASGICAAISHARRGENVILLEKMPQLGKKILASGGGRCNLLNKDMSEANYNPAARELVRSVFSQFGKDAILDFFKGLGLQVHAIEGRIFPLTNQSSSVLKVLEMELHRLSIPVAFNFECTDISFSGNSILILSRAGERISCRRVIIAGGGRTYPALGSDGGLYQIAERLGHTLAEPVPVAVPLVVKDNLCQVLQGQKVLALARSLVDGKEIEQASGELLFTKYGLSGTCILDVSESISVAINRQHKSAVFVAVDMAPSMTREQLKIELEKRRKANWTAEEMLVGILPNKVVAALKYLFETSDLDDATTSLKDHRFKVSGTRGWNEAEFTSGGIKVDEVNIRTLESKVKNGVYFAGEILDVHGKRGGYNLGWAWASGMVAGQTG